MNTIVKRTEEIEGKLNNKGDSWEQLFFYCETDKVKRCDLDKNSLWMNKVEQLSVYFSLGLIYKEFFIEIIIFCLFLQDEEQQENPFMNECSLKGMLSKLPFNIYTHTHIPFFWLVRELCAPGTLVHSLLSIVMEMLMQIISLNQMLSAFNFYKYIFFWLINIVTTVNEFLCHA